jgi:hypothetical protein
LGKSLVLFLLSGLDRQREISPDSSLKAEEARPKSI